MPAVVGGGGGVQPPSARDAAQALVSDASQDCDEVRQGKTGAPPSVVAGSTVSATHRRLRELEAICGDAPAGLCLLDAGLRFRYINRRLADIDGLSIDAHIGQTLTELLPDIAREMEQPLRSVLDHGAPLSNLVLQGRTARGRALDRWWQIDLYPYRETRGDDAVAGVVVVVRDITASRRDTTRILHLSRLYAAISETNAALLRCRNADEVYRAVCQACVNHTDFGLAWVGLADAGRGVIVPVKAAARGMEPVVGAITVPIVPEHAARDTAAARAHRDQCPSLCSNPDPIATAHGLGSSLALPLKRGGAPFGTLTVCGEDDALFGDEALRLLKDMADNLSFALDLFDRETQRQAAEVALRDSAARLHEAQALCRTGDWELDRHQGRLHWSPGLFRLFERPESAGPPDLNEAMAYYSPAALEYTRERFWHAIDTGERCTLEHSVVLPSGKIRHHVTLIIPVVDADGRVDTLYGTVQDITERKELELERAAHVARLATLSSHLVEVQERERRQLAGELHDRASPNLAALQLTLSNLASALPAAVLEQLQPMLDDTQALLADTTAGIREICTNLRPATLDYAGLAPALEEYARHFGRRSGIGVCLDCASFDVELPPSVQSLLFRIAQEALTNCAKHAAPTTIAVQLSSTADEIRMRIEDDGIGFDPALLGEPGCSPGLGLITMKERAEFAGGRFHFDTAPGLGTRIEIAFDTRLVDRQAQRMPGTLHDQAEHHYDPDHHPGRRRGDLPGEPR